MCNTSKIVTCIAVGAALSVGCCMLLKKDARVSARFKRAVDDAINMAVDTISDAAEKIADTLGME